MKWLLKHKWITTSCVLLYIFMVASFTYRLPNQSLTLKGNLTAVDTSIGESNESNFYTIYVVSMDRPTLFQYFIATLIDQIDISTLPHAYVGISAADQFKMGQIAEEISYQYAIIQAYTQANLIDPSIEITYVQQGYIVSYVDPKQSGIKLGDLLIEVEGVSFSDVPQNEFFGYFSTQDTVNIAVQRGTNRIENTLHKLASIDRYGIQLEPYFSISTTPTIETSFKNDFIGGPSGGLIQTLDIYTKLLGIDLKGLKIAGTGTIELDGSIGEIGGIEQKIYTAHDHDIDIFLCASANYEAALKVYENLKNPTFILIEVGDLNEAIQKIMSHIS